MSTNIDPRRSIADWLEAEAPDRAPARLVESSRERIRTTRQRPAWLPARRSFDMNSFAKLAMAAAAVVVVAIVGYNLLPSQGGVGGLPATPSPSISPSTPPPTPVQVTPSGGLVNGPLQPGTYTNNAVDGTSVNIQFTVPAGWQWHDGWILTKTSTDPPDGHAITFRTGDIQIYTDPCHWEGTEPDPPTGPTARDVVDALAAQPMRNASTPTERKAAGPTGADQWSGWTVDVSVPNDIDFSQCTRGEFRSWGPEQNARFHQGSGQRDTVWAIDVDPDTRIVVDAASFPGTPETTMTEIDAILDSMVFEPRS